MRIRNVLAVALIALASACAAEDLPGLEGPDDIDDSAITESGKADSLNSTATYYSVERDVRKCAAPACGGWFVSRVNREWTKCHDGKWRNACYVADMDAAGLGLSDDELASVYDAAEQGQIVMRGKIAAARYNGQRFGQFRPSEAWRASTGAAPSGDFYKLTDKQLVCIYAPCPSLHEAKLNSTLAQDIHSLDLSRVGSESLANQAWLEMDERPILVAGTHSTFVAPLGGAKGTSLDATQYYTRVRHDALSVYVPTEADLAGNAFTAAASAAASYPRTYRFDAGTVVVEDAIAPCTATCIWSGIVSRGASWTLSGDRVLLTFDSEPTQAYPLEYVTQLQVKKDSLGRLVLVELQDDGQPGERRFAAE